MEISVSVNCVRVDGEENDISPRSTTRESEHLLISHKSICTNLRFSSVCFRKCSRGAERRSSVDEEAIRRVQGLRSIVHESNDVDGGR